MHIYMCTHVCVYASSFDLLQVLKEKERLIQKNYPVEVNVSKKGKVHSQIEIMEILSWDKNVGLEPDVW